MRHRLPLIAVLASIATLGPGASAAVAADDLLYRCYPNLCKMRPDGSNKRQLTRDGKRSGPVYAWLSASRNGKRLGISYGNDAFVANARGRRLGKKYKDSGGAVLIAQISPNGRELATIENILELRYPPPVGGIIGPPISVLVPYLFHANVRSRERKTTARSIVTAGWLGNRLLRDETADESPFEQQICLLSSNAAFACDRLVAREAGREIWTPAGSPTGRYVAAVSAPDDEVRGPIKIFSAATGQPIRTLTRGDASNPSWSRDGKRIAYSSGGSIWTVRASGGRARRVAKGLQPVWVPR